MFSNIRNNTTPTHPVITDIISKPWPLCLISYSLYCAVDCSSDLCAWVFKLKMKDILVVWNFIIQIFLSVSEPRFMVMQNDVNFMTACLSSRECRTGEQLSYNQSGS